MYAFRTTHGPADLCFTDRFGGVSASPYDELNLALDGEDPVEARVANHRRVLDDFAPDDELCDVEQVHGAEVDVVEETVLTEGDRPRADAMVARSAGVTLMVRAADCVPVLMVAADEAVIAAVHAGRSGLLLGVVPNAVRAMREAGAATAITAWVGPHICGSCYEVPADMQDEVAAAVPTSRATTSWGTPSLDLGAGVRAQLEADGVTVVDASRCTRESPDLYSHRRDGRGAGRHAGLIRLRDAR